METTEAALAVLGAHLRSWATWATTFQAKVAGFTSHLVWKATGTATDKLDGLMTYRTASTDGVVALAKVYRFLSETYQDGYWTHWYQSHEIDEDEEVYDIIYPQPITIGGYYLGDHLTEIGESGLTYIQSGLNLPIGIEHIVRTLNEKVHTDDPRLSWREAIHLDNVWLAMENLPVQRYHKVAVAQDVSHLIRLMIATTKEAILQLGSLSQRIHKAIQMENSWSILGDTFYHCRCSYCKTVNTEQDEINHLLCKDDQVISECHVYATHCLGCLALAIVSGKPEIRSPLYGLDEEANLNHLYTHPLAIHPSSPPAAILLDGGERHTRIASDQYAKVSQSNEMTPKVF